MRDYACGFPFDDFPLYFVEKLAGFKAGFEFADQRGQAHGFHGAEVASVEGVELVGGEELVFEGRNVLCETAVQMLVHFLGYGFQSGAVEDVDGKKS